MPCKRPLSERRLGDYEALARQSLDAGVWRYLSEGDSEANEAALRSVRLLPRPLADVRGGHTRLRLFGQDFEHPLIVAPLAYQKLFHPDGEMASALAASAQGGQMVISSLASQPIADLAACALCDGGQAPWFQLYWQGSRERTRRLLDKAVEAGCGAVMFTVDAPVKLASLMLPEGVAAVNLEPVPRKRAPGKSVFDNFMQDAPVWDDLNWLREQTSQPLIVKGVLCGEDAARALSAGCNGVVVSNHGGRVLEGARTSLQALDEVVATVQGRAPVLFDSGVRSGRDAFVALSRGASAVLVGRPCLWGLAADGAMGVAHVIRLMRDELEMTMALTGVTDLTRL